MTLKVATKQVRERTAVGCDDETNPHYGGGLDFSNVELASGSVLLRDDAGTSVNANIGDLVRKIIKQTIDCGYDEDEDGELDSEEDDDAADEDEIDD